MKYLLMNVLKLNLNSRDKSKKNLNHFEKIMDENDVLRMRIRI